MASGNVGSWKLLLMTSPVRAQPGSAARAAVISESGSFAGLAIGLYSSATRPTRHTRGVPLDIPEAESPIEVELDRARGLALRWADGTTAHFDFEELRRNCPCAECRGVRDQGREAGRRDPHAIDAR